MNANDELSRRLAATAEAIDTEPDLSDVIARSGRKRTRSRQMAAAGATAVVLAGVGALGLATTRGDRATTDLPAPVESATPSTSNSPANSEPIASSPPETLAEQPVASSVEPPPESSQAPDRADPYLDQATVIFDQVMNDDQRFVISISDISYGELFDIGWTAPTGSVEECLDGPALIFGDPSGERGNNNDGSAWDAWPLPALSDDLDTHVANASGPFAFDLSAERLTSVIIVRSRLPVIDVTVSGDEVTTRTAEFVNGVAAIQVDAAPERDESGSKSPGLDRATLTMQTEPGVDLDPTLLSLPLATRLVAETAPDQCLPTFPDAPELPPAGVQPPDPAAAEIAIRDRFALAVDLTIPFDDKPDDLFDSSNGLGAAIERAQTGANAGYVRSAEYDITDIVFTSPDEAWFMYDLDALGVSYRPFGQATLNGDNWQISRATVCQDLTRAGVFCDTDQPTEPVMPPADPAAPPTTVLTQEQVATYEESLFCNPLRSC